MWEDIMEGLKLKKIEKVKIGEKVCFLPYGNYVVREIGRTKIGMIRHRHDSGSACYWPGECVYVERRNS